MELKVVIQVDQVDHLDQVDQRKGRCQVALRRYDDVGVRLPPLGQSNLLVGIDEAQVSAINIGNGDSLDLLQAVYRNTAEPIGRRIRAAIAALPHEHPKLAVTANLNGEAFGDALERAIARSGKAEVINNALMIERQSVEQN